MIAEHVEADTTLGASAGVLRIPPGMSVTQLVCPSLTAQPEGRSEDFTRTT